MMVVESYVLLRMINYLFPAMNAFLFECDVARHAKTITPCIIVAGPKYRNIPAGELPAAYCLF